LHTISNPKLELVRLYRGKTVSFGIILIITFSLVFGFSPVVSEDPQPQGSITGVPPQIILLDPIDGATEVPLNQDVAITFSESMNETATQDAFEISPTVLGNFTWAGDTMIFSPLTQFAEGTFYQLKITASAMDLENETLDGNGNGVEDGSTADDFLWDFTTATQPPQVDSVYPLPGSNMIFTDSKIIINFTQSMDTQSVMDTLVIIVDSIEFPASSSGNPLWSNSDMTMTFTPFTKMQHNKTYEYIVNYTAESATGSLFDGDLDGIGGEVGQDDYHWSFTTIPEPPKVQTVEPRNQEQKVAADPIISVKFSKSMNQVSVEDAFSFTHSDTETTWDATFCNVTWVSLSKVEFEPTFHLDHERTYTVTIEASCFSSEGVTLDGDKDKKPEGIEIDSHDWSFTIIAESPKIESFEPAEGAKEVLLDAEIVITFDKSMDTKSTEKAFTYTYEGSIDEFDSTSGAVIWTNNNKVMTFQPDVNYEEGKTYTVIMDSDAEDEDGIEFEGFSWPFTTKINSEPELTGGGIFPETGDTETLFTFVVLYVDEDDDPPDKVLVYIDGADFKMSESDPKVDSFIFGKIYEFEIELESGTHEYYFEVENEQHEARYPQGSVTRSIKVTQKEEEKTFGMFEEEYAGIPTMICLPIGIIILIGIIIAVVLLAKRSKARKQVASAGTMTFEPESPTMNFLPEDIPGDFMTFDMAPEEEELMSFQTFDENIPPPVDAPPVMIQCPECGEKLKVRAARRPFSFPCKCGAKLVLK
jgi:hypothetical protein